MVLTAMGPGVEEFHGRIDNTRVFRIMARALASAAGIDGGWQVTLGVSGLTRGIARKNQLPTRLARWSSSKTATFQRTARESFLPDDFSRIRFRAMCVIGADAAFVVAEVHIQYPMKAVLDHPGAPEGWRDQVGEPDQ